MTSLGTNQFSAQQERMLRKQESPDFLNPLLEWRRLFAEGWGTFLLVLVAAGGVVVSARSGGVVTLGMIVVAPGLMVMVIIYFMGTVSGARFKSCSDLGLCRAA